MSSFILGGGRQEIGALNFPLPIHFTSGSGFRLFMLFLLRNIAAIFPISSSSCHLSAFRPLPQPSSSHYSRLPVPLSPPPPLFTVSNLYSSLTNRRSCQYPVYHHLFLHCLFVFTEPYQNLPVFILAEITDFQADETFQGLTHQNGRLKVDNGGVFYIYSQVFFEHYSGAPRYHNRVALTVNGAPFSLMQTGIDGYADYGSLSTGGVIRLRKGDYISLVTVYDSRLWVSRAHTFFGAYRVSE